MNKEIEKKCKKLLKGANAVLVATDNGYVIVGEKANILVLLTGIMERLFEGKNVNKDELELCLKLATNKEEADEIFKEKISNLVDDLFESLKQRQEELSKKDGDKNE